MWNRSWCEITTTVPLIWSIWPQFYQFPSFRISLLPVSFSSLILPPVNSIQPFILISSTFQSPVPSLPVPSLPSLHNFPFTTFPSLLVISSPSHPSLHNFPFTTFPSQLYLHNFPFTSFSSHPPLHNFPFTTFPSHLSLHILPFTSSPSQLSLHFWSSPPLHNLPFTTFPSLLVISSPPQLPLHKFIWVSEPNI